MPKLALSTLIFSRSVPSFDQLTQLSENCLTRTIGNAITRNDTSIKPSNDDAPEDPTMSFLNAATKAYACSGWYYRGGWHQTCPELELLRTLYLLTSPGFAS